MPTSLSTSAPPVSEIQRVFQMQKRAQKAEGISPLRGRRRQLQTLRKVLLGRRRELHEAMRHDFRKPRTEVDLIELQTVRQEIDHALSNLREWTTPHPVGSPPLLTGTTSEIRYEPKGVVLILAPWNYPVTLTLGPLVSALAAGNRAIVKPSEFAPDTAQVIAEIVAECFSEHEVACITGPKETAQALVRLPFDHIFFTGSKSVGREVMKAAAEHLASVTLELGGKSPAVVGPDADVDEAAWKIAWTKFSNAGQTCLAPDYVLVHRSREAELIYSLKRQLRAFYGFSSDDRRRSPDFARLVRKQQFDHVKSLLDDAVSKGAQIEDGGNMRLEERYIAPTILSWVPENARIMHEEIFGPVLPVVPFDVAEQAIAFISDRPDPLVVFLYDGGDDFVERVAAETRSGGACINDVPLHFYNPELPFGGVGSSGFGRSHGEAGFKTFSNERSFIRRRAGSSALKMLAPPYRRPFKKLLRKIVRHL